MNDLKAAYILNQDELRFLFDSKPDIPLSGPAQYIRNQSLSKGGAPRDAAEGLIYKKLAKRAHGKIALEPVVDLLLRAALLSEFLWIVKCAGIDGPVLVLKAEGVYLHIRRYPHISGAWKITPYQNKETLLGEFDGIDILEANGVDRRGIQRLLQVDGNTLWIEDGEE